jgi:hypothetical protein
VATKQVLEILMDDAAHKDKARMAQHVTEQPDDPARIRFVVQGVDEAGEVDLGLQACGRFEAHLVRPGAFSGRMAARWHFTAV